MNLTTHMWFCAWSAEESSFPGSDGQFVCTFAHVYLWEVWMWSLFLQEGCRQQYKLICWHMNFRGCDNNSRKYKLSLVLSLFSVCALQFSKKGRCAVSWPAIGFADWLKRNSLLWFCGPEYKKFPPLHQSIIMSLCKLYIFNENT